MCSDASWEWGVCLRISIFSKEYQLHCLRRDTKRALVLTDSIFSKEYQLHFLRITYLVKNTNCIKEYQLHCLRIPYLVKNTTALLTDSIFSKEYQLHCLRIPYLVKNNQLHCLRIPYLVKNTNCILSSILGIYTSHAIFYSPFYVTLYVTMSEAASSYGEDIVERTGHLIRCLTANIDNSSSPTPSISTVGGVSLSDHTNLNTLAAYNDVPTSSPPIPSSFSSTQETDYCQEISDAEMLLAEGSSDNPIDVDREDDEYNDGLSDKDIYDAYATPAVYSSNTVLDETVMNQMSTRIALSSIQFAQFWQSNRKYWQGRRQVNRETFKVQKSMTTSGRFSSRPVVPSPPVVWEQGSPSRSKGKDPVIHSDW
ncbi:hypothetical protein BGX38DRAFT_1147092 [Terfezia claveryi]|nr:hypothetical protein BGX38DRAFT_1147092 [Terfezia claveryi]